MLQNRLLGWHPGLFQQPALFVLTSIWLGHGSPWRFSCHWQTGRRANGSLGAGKVHNLSKVLNFPSWRKHVKCRLYRFVEFQSDKDVTAVLEKPAQSGKVASNSLEWCNGSLYPCCPSCPPCDGITFPKHDGCVDENVCWPLSAKAFPPGQRWSGCGPQPDHLCPGGQQRNVTAPILATVGSRDWAMEAANHMWRALE